MVALKLDNAPSARGSAVDINRRFYDALWSSGALTEPQLFNTWPLLSSLADKAPRRLEIGPGLRPRLPLSGTVFTDLSAPALSQLTTRGRVTRGLVTQLPFSDQSFDLVCAFDIVEHVEDDHQVFGEMARVARDGAPIVFSVPLQPERWTSFDALVGHVRRYDTPELLQRLQQHALTLEQSAVYGMEPKQKWLLELAAWGMRRRWDQAVRWYNKYFLPIGLRNQKPLDWIPGLVDVAGVGEIVLLCRRQSRT